MDITSSLVQGLMYGIGTMGLAITFRYLRFPDFTVLGSIMIGGIICTWFANLTNPWLGILAGTIAGGILGIMTSIQHTWAGINPVLASIITFTGSYTLGYEFSNGGTIQLEEMKQTLFNPIFNMQDSIVVLILAIFISILIGLMMSSKFGSKILAMRAPKKFLKFRHRDKKSVFTALMFIGNSLVGLAGSLLALRVVSSTVKGHVEFLPQAIGGIFGASALFAFVILKLGRSINISDDEQQKKKIKDLAISKTHFLNQEKPTNIGFIFFGFFIFTAILHIIANEISKLNDFSFIGINIEIPHSFHFIIQSLVIFAFVLFYGKFDEEYI